MDIISSITFYKYKEYYQYYHLLQISSALPVAYEYYKDDIPSLWYIFYKLQGYRQFHLH